MKKDILIEFQVYLNNKKLINNYDWDFEKEAKKFIKQRVVEPKKCKCRKATFSREKFLNMKENTLWDNLWQEFILDCENSNKKIIEASDFYFWLDYGFKVPERL